MVVKTLEEYLWKDKNEEEVSIELSSHEKEM